MVDSCKKLLGSVFWNLAQYTLGYGFVFLVVIKGCLKFCRVNEESFREFPPGKAISRLGGPNTEHVGLAGQFDHALFFGVVRLQGLVAL
jgi:hypothetical protein